MLIKEAEVVCADTETTGLDTENDRIVEFGATVFRSGIVAERGRALINPTIPIADEARKVHKITNERVAGCPVFSEVAERIQKKFDSCDVIVGYNNKRFDDPLINAEFARAGIDWRIPDDKSLDVVVFVNWHHRGERPRTQEAIGAKLYNVHPEAGQAHSAAVDTQMTGELLFAMIDAGVIPENLEDALAAQAKFFPIIEQEFTDYGPWLYRDRQTRRLRMGAGKHCGRLLADVPKGSYGWYLNNIEDLPAPARHAFESAKAGRTQDEIQESMLEFEEEQKAKKADDVSGWGG